MSIMEIPNKKDISSKPNMKQYKLDNFVINEENSKISTVLNEEHNKISESEKKNNGSEPSCISIVDKSKPEEVDLINNKAKRENNPFTNPEYETWLKKSSKGEEYGFCTLCLSDFN